MFKKHQAKKEEEHRQDELRAFVDSLVDPAGIISEENQERILEYFKQHGFSHVGDDAVTELEIPADVSKAFTLGLANRGQFIACDTTLLLGHDEAARCETPADLLKEVTKREFQGASRGISVSLGHGIRYRTGAARGHMVTLGTEWQTADSGMLTITDQRVVFHGGRKTLEFPFAKLATLDTYSDAIDLGVTSRQTTSSFRLEDPHFVAGMIHAAFADSTS